MKALFINRLTPDLDLFTETACFYNLYFIADKAYLSSTLSIFILLYQNSSYWSEKFIINRFKIDVKNWEEIISEKQMEELIRAAKFIRNLKHKDKQALLMISKVTKLISSFKKVLIDAYESKFIEVHVLEWIDLFEKETIVILNSSDYEADKNTAKEDHLIGLISEDFLEEEYKQEFSLLLPKIVELKKGFFIEKEYNDIEDRPDFYSFPLYQMPLIPSLSKQTMPIIRSELRRKAQAIISLLKEFKTAMQQEVFGNHIKEMAEIFYERIKPETELFQQSIHKQLYFQQAINAGGNFVTYQLNVGISSVGTVIDYYSESKILLPFVYEALKKNLSVQIDINKCDVFLYLSEVEEINKTEE